MDVQLTMTSQQTLSLCAHVPIPPTLPSYWPPMEMMLVYTLTSSAILLWPYLWLLWLSRCSSTHASGELPSQPCVLVYWPLMSLDQVALVTTELRSCTAVSVSDSLSTRICHSYWQNTQSGINWALLSDLWVSCITWSLPNLSESCKINVIGTTELKLWPFKDALNANINFLCTDILLCSCCSLAILVHGGLPVVVDGGGGALCGCDQD